MSTKQTTADKSDRESHAKRFFNQQAKLILGMADYHALRHGKSDTGLVADEAVEHFMLEIGSEKAEIRRKSGESHIQAFNVVMKEWPDPAVGKLARHELLSEISEASGNTGYQKFLKMIAEHRGEL